MYSDKLEQLIECALADGVITETERKVLIRNAIKEGIDEDEFTMVLDARLHKLREAAGIASAPPIPAPPVPAENAMPAKGSKHGDVTKCPSCGAPLEGISHKCKSCGFEFRHVAAVSSARELFEKLINTANSKDKLRLISTYPVPNAKEDLMELLTMSVSNSYVGGPHLSPDEEAWLKKSSQIYQKILIVCAGDNATIMTATQLVATLISQLPNRYKNFTNVPVNLRSVVAQAEQQAAAQRNKRRNETYKFVMFKTLPGLRFTLLLVALLICLLFVIFGTTDIKGIFLIVGFYALIGVGLSFNSFNKRLEEER